MTLHIIEIRPADRDDLEMFEGVCSCGHARPPWDFSTPGGALDAVLAHISAGEVWMASFNPVPRSRH